VRPPPVKALGEGVRVRSVNTTSLCCCSPAVELCLERRALFGAITITPAEPRAAKRWKTPRGKMPVSS